MSALRYGSVCSGVEAASVAWQPLGWEPQWFSEIEKFPSAVLAHHYPNTPNLGDMAKFKEWNDDPIDLLVGGTPCQSFSVAGLRKGLDDPRGNLMLTYVAIAARYKPRWLVWENVPGVLSSNGGRDFGTFLTALGEIGYGFAYRVLDAQYFGVAQRRRRVFVVGYLGDWRRAAAVLFERESLSGHSAPSREAREETADTLTVGANQYSGFNGEPVVVGALDMQCGGGKLTHQSANNGHLIAARSDQDTASCIAFSSNMSVPDCQTDGTTPTVKLGGHGGGNPPAVVYDTTNITSPTNGSNPQPGDPVFTLASGQHPPLLTSMQVRRLTPTECERLQGFPDNYTQIPYRNKPAESCPDGPRYKAMGNSMAVPVMRWIGERINMVNSIGEKL
jgi:DNA (cytosine-5)-methyltransferase 1